MDNHAIHLAAVSLWPLLAEFWDVLAEMAPYLLFGFFAAGVLSVFVSAAFVERHLGGRGLWPIVKASIFGVPLPLCSCGVIPVSASLRRHGASRGATTSFLISTPQTGVDSIAVTFSLLGPAFAFFRPIAALISGVLGGAWVSLVTANQERPSAAPSPEACQESCCAASSHGRLHRAMAYGFGALPQDIGKALLVGLAIAATISVLLPPNFVAQLLGGGRGLVPILVMMAAGIPVYVCATASVPIAAALIWTQGIWPGAAFAFLVTGPATNAATIATIWRIMGRRTAIIYLATMAVSAVVGGLVLDALVPPQAVRQVSEMGWMLPPAVNHAAAVTLLALLAYPMIKPLARRARKAEPLPALRTEILAITGMTCSHCALAVRGALLACPGVKEVEVDLAGDKAVVRGDGLDVQAMLAAVQELGYRVQQVSELPAPQLKERLVEEMKRVFAHDRKRIDHALEVLDYAERIWQVEGGDLAVVQAAAILHDIGICQAERKYDSSAGQYQELEGPPIARPMLQQLGLQEQRIEHVCRIIASHHSGGDIDSTEFRIVWDADRIANAPEECAGRTDQQLASFIDSVYLTCGGKALGRQKLLAGR